MVCLGDVQSTKDSAAPVLVSSKARCHGQSSVAAGKRIGPQIIALLEWFERTVGLRVNLQDICVCFMWC